MTPRQSVTAEVGRNGAGAVAARCTEILSSGPTDDQFLFVLAGPAARQVLEGREGGVAGHWPRVWALRGLLYAWDESAIPEVIRATGDESWRVREMATKVLAAHRVTSGLHALKRLQADPVPRVRAGADRALDIIEFG